MRTGSFAVVLGLVAFIARGADGAIDPADAAEPQPFEVLTSRPSPRAGSHFIGVAVATLEEGARLYRSVTPWCTAGRIRVGSSMELSLPVRISRLPRNPQAGGSVRSVTTCSWHVPRSARGKGLAAQAVIDLVNTDGSSGRSSQTVEWVVR
jgi:hypothetical protein